MLIKTNRSIHEIGREIFTNNTFGVPKYQAILEGNSRFFVFEEYTFRNGNYMTISVILEDKEDYRLIHYVVAGAAQGIFGITWGAQGSREKRILKQLDLKNFDYEILGQ